MNNITYKFIEIKSKLELILSEFFFFSTCINLYNNFKENQIERKIRR